MTAARSYPLGVPVVEETRASLIDRRALGYDRERLRMVLAAFASRNGRVFEVVS